MATLGLRNWFAAALLIGHLASASHPDTRSSPASLIQLIARPADYDGKRVRTAGYLYLAGSEDNSVCISRVSVPDEWLPSTCVFVVLPGTVRARIRSGRVVEIVGTFRRSSDPNLMPLGSIVQVESVRELWPRADTAR